MTIVCHEGLPRSGKSYASVKDFIIPMVRSGRKVYARLNGLNHVRIAQILGIEVEECKARLIAISDEDVKRIAEIVDNDSFIIIDEIQDHYPNARKPLDPSSQKLVTQHGHRGLDILIMTQELSGVHKTWRDRVAQKVVFQKMDAIGRPDYYSFVVQKPVKNGEKVNWVTVGKSDAGGVRYDEQYFDCYDSHVAGTENFSALKDDRAVIWKTPLFRRWLPIFGVALLWAGWKFYDAMWGGHLVKTAPVASVPAAQSFPTPPVDQGNIRPASMMPQAQTLGAAPMPAPMLNVVDDLMVRAKPRMLGYYRNGNRTEALIEWRQGDNRVVQRFKSAQLEALGWAVFVDSSGTMAVIQSADRRYVITSWPVADEEGRASESRLETVKPQDGGYHKQEQPKSFEPWTAKTSADAPMDNGITPRDYFARSGS